MQHEDDTLGRGEPLQDDEEREPHAVVERDPVSRIDRPAAGQDGCGRGGCLDAGGIVRPFVAGASGPDLVKAQPAGHDDQPASRVFDLGEIFPDQPPERVLDDVLCGADVAQHAERQVDEVGPVLVPGQDGLFVVAWSAHPGALTR